ncbi:DNA mismatch repair protein MSH4 [Pancytospora philotis]|nr:DNA mismatch repair protein MSH4 [Pancytospora philotis]
MYCCVTVDENHVSVVGIDIVAGGDAFSQCSTYRYWQTPVPTGLTNLRDSAAADDARRGVDAKMDCIEFDDEPDFRHLKQFAALNPAVLIASTNMRQLCGVIGEGALLYEVRSAGAAGLQELLLQLRQSDKMTAGVQRSAAQRTSDRDHRLLRDITNRPSHKRLKSNADAVASISQMNSSLQYVNSSLEKAHTRLHNGEQALLSASHGGASACEASATVKSSEQLPDAEKRATISARVLERLNLTGVTSSIISAIDFTSTKMGRRMLEESLRAPLLCPTTIAQRQEFVKKYMRDTRIDRIVEVLRGLPDIDSLSDALESMPLRACSSTVACSKSLSKASGYRASSLHTRTSESLDCPSVFASASAASATGEFSSLAAMSDSIGTAFIGDCGLSEFMKLIHYMEKLLSIIKALDYIDAACPDLFPGLSAVARGADFVLLRAALDALVDREYNTVKAVLYENIAFIIRPGKDEYLDLARSLYRRSVDDCQRALVELSETRTELKIYRDKSIGMCLRARTDSPNDVASGNRSIKEACSALSSEERLVVLKSTRLYTFYTTSGIQTMNCKASDAFMQVVELTGKLCMSFIATHRRPLLKLKQISRIVAEADLLIGIIAFQRSAERSSDCGRTLTTPVFTNSLTIRECIDLALSKTVQTYPQQYSFSSSSNFIMLVGPNMAGKSSYARCLVQAIVMAQSGFPVPAARADMVVYASIFHVSSCADIQEVLSARCAHEAAQPSASTTESSTRLKNGKMLVVVDELECALPILLAFTKALLESDAHTVFITHRLALLPRVRSYANARVLECQGYCARPALTATPNALKLCTEHLPEELSRSILAYRAVYSQHASNRTSKDD